MNWSEFHHSVWCEKSGLIGLQTDVKMAIAHIALVFVVLPDKIDVND